METAERYDESYVQDWSSLSSLVFFFPTVVD